MIEDEQHIQISSNLQYAIKSYNIFRKFDAKTGKPLLF